MTSPAMCKTLGEHAHTPEAQALAREVVNTLVAQSPELQVPSHVVVHTQQARSA